MQKLYLGISPLISSTSFLSLTPHQPVQVTSWLILLVLVFIEVSTCIYVCFFSFNKTYLIFHNLCFSMTVYPGNYSPQSLDIFLIVFCSSIVLSCVYEPQFLQPLSYGHLSNFQYLAITNNATKNNVLLQSWIFRVNYIEIGLLDWRVNAYVVLVASAKIFSKGVCTILHSCQQFSTTFGPTAIKRFLNLMGYEVTGNTTINSLKNSNFMRSPV